MEQQQYGFSIIEVIKRTVIDSAKSFLPAVIWAAPALVVLAILGLVFEVAVLFQKTLFYYTPVLIHKTGVEEVLEEASMTSIMNTSMFSIFSTLLLCPILVFMIQRLVSGSAKTKYLNIFRKKIFWQLVGFLVLVFISLLLSVYLYAKVLSVFIWANLPETVLTILNTILGVAIAYGVLRILLHLTCVLPLLVLEEKKVIATSFRYTNGFLLKIAFTLLFLAPLIFGCSILFTSTLGYAAKTVMDFLIIDCELNEAICIASWRYSLLPLTVNYLLSVFSLVINSSITCNIFLVLRRLYQAKENQQQFE